jgi:hypothetical protein
MIFFTPVDPCDKQESNFGSNFLNFFLKEREKKKRSFTNQKRKEDKGFIVNYLARCQKGEINLHFAVLLNLEIAPKRVGICIVFLAFWDQHC